MCKKTQCAKGLQALSIRGYTLQLYLDNFILGYAGLSFFNNKEKDGLYMNQTMEIEDKRTVYGECTYHMIPREDEPSVCLMHDWIYLPSA